MKRKRRQKKRFKGKEVPRTYIERLKKELKVIAKMGFNDYFLIVFDYVRFAKTHDIQVGPGRGSAAGSLVSYVLGITNIDPLKYDLLFERFLNEERVSMPDIDIDFQDDKRDEVVKYVSEKYGQEYVGQIVTFATYGPKVALRDLGKVVSVPLPKLEMMSKYIPTQGKNRKTVKEVYESSYAFASMVNQEEMLRKILPAIYLVEHLPRNISMHAAGVVLSGDCLNEVVPLTKGPNQNVLTQYSKNYIESVGLLKMDFLGLKNLTVISDILKNIEKYEGVHLNLNTIPLNDEKTFKMLSNGDTLGVFQLESPGMKNLLIKMQCNCLDDLIAAIALFRPGPKSQIPHYIARKFHQEKVEYPHDDLKDILKSTYGIIIYQEQLMQVAQKIAGFSLAKADILRQATSKKTLGLMESMKEEFISGALKNGYEKNQAEYIFGLIEKFADYGFNKAHAMHSRCFCPPETFVPPCSICVLYFKGNCWINSSAWASLQAWAISSGVAFLSPQRRFSSIVPENRIFICKTTATWFRSVLRSYSLTSLPPTFTTPSVVSYRREINWIKVDLEEPVPPIIPTVSPDRILRSAPSITFLSARLL